MLNQYGYLKLMVHQREITADHKLIFYLQGLLTRIAIEIVRYFTFNRHLYKTALKEMRYEFTNKRLSVEGLSNSYNNSTHRSVETQILYVFFQTCQVLFKSQTLLIFC